MAIVFDGRVGSSLPRCPAPRKTHSRSGGRRWPVWPAGRSAVLRFSRVGPLFQLPPAPLAWGYDPFANYGPCDPGPICALHPVTCPGNFVAHRPSAWYGSADFAPLTMDRLDGMPLARSGPLGVNVLTTRTCEPSSPRRKIHHRPAHLRLLPRSKAPTSVYHSWEDDRLVVNSTPNSNGGTGKPLHIPFRFLEPCHSRTRRSQFRLRLRSLEFSKWRSQPALLGRHAAGPLDVSVLVGVRPTCGSMIKFNFVARLISGWSRHDGRLADQHRQRHVGRPDRHPVRHLVTTRWWLDVDLKGGIFSDHVALRLWPPPTAFPPSSPTLATAPSGWATSRSLPTGK